MHVVGHLTLVSLAADSEAGRMRNGYRSLLHESMHIVQNC